MTNAQKPFSSKLDDTEGFLSLFWTTEHLHPCVSLHKGMCYWATCTAQLWFSLHYTTHAHIHTESKSYWYRSPHQSCNCSYTRSTVPFCTFPCDSRKWLGLYQVSQIAGTLTLYLQLMILVKELCDAVIQQLMCISLLDITAIPKLWHHRVSSKFVAEKAEGDFFCLTLTLWMATHNSRHVFITILVVMVKHLHRCKWCHCRFT